MPPVVAAAAAAPALFTAGATVASGLGGALIGSHSAGNAANIQATAAQKALDVQKQIYDQQRADRAPYLAASTGALGSLGQLAQKPQYMAMPAQRLGASSPTAPAMPSSLGQLGQAPPMAAAPDNGAPAGMVTVQDPQSGQQMHIPQQNLQTALSRGLKQVS